MDNILKIKDLKVYYPKYKGVFRTLDYYVKAVDGVSLSIRAGATLGLVGESGCGKTTTGKAVIGLTPVTGGSITFRGRDITRPTETERRENARYLQIIFQDPYASLNPKMKIGHIIDEAVSVRYPGSPRYELAEKTGALLQAVGLHADDYEKYPHEFSGGQRQRIGITRAIAVEPEFIICDESVSALDVSIQADIINLLKDLQEEKKLTYLFIAHDLTVVRYISSEVAIMYLGRIVEYGTRDEIFSKPLHPYTVSLMSAVPKVGRGKDRKRIILEGDVPSPVNKPSGCPFHPRCYMRKPECSSLEVRLEDKGEGHLSACPFNV